MSETKTRVLVVDDSALARSILTQGLGKDSDIEVIGTASDVFIARDKILELKPDVMTLDVEMPKMDGVEFLRRLIPQWPLPTIVVSSLTEKGKTISLQALEAGAIDVVTKPSSNMSNSLPEMLTHLCTLVKGAKGAHVSQKKISPSNAKPIASSKALAESTDKVIAIGASTGGTEALRTVIPQFPADTPGVVVVQHMPPGFTNRFAESLNQISAMEVKEAVSGDRIMNGRVLIAPGGLQMKVIRSGGIYEVVCQGTEKVSSHCPSVDVLMNSVAEHVGGNAVGAMLTGMGQDGAKGMKAMADKGCLNVVQNEASCVVYGMPKAAYEQGGASELKDLSQIASTLLKYITIQSRNNK